MTGPGDKSYILLLTVNRELFNKKISKNSSFTKVQLSDPSYKDCDCKSFRIWSIQLKNKAENSISLANILSIQAGAKLNF